MKRWYGIIMAIFLVACASAGQLPRQPVGIEASGALDMNDPAAQTDNTVEASQPVRADLEDFGAAPELANEVWLNTDQPLRLADLRGKVVLLDMWTYG